MKQKHTNKSMHSEMGPVRLHSFSCCCLEGRGWIRRVLR